MIHMDEIVDVEAIAPQTVVEYLNEISYSVPEDYEPTPFALEFMNFIKLVNGAQGEENKSPVVHYYMLDQM